MNISNFMHKDIQQGEVSKVCTGMYSHAQIYLHLLHLPIWFVWGKSQIKNCWKWNLNKFFGKKKFFPQFNM